jgi:hypothetical protein
MADNLEFEELSDAIQGGLANVSKWYRKTDQTDVYFISLGQYYQ